ncbi:MAG: hypothetical protein J0H62_02465 [Rhizobiales bacterium]|nr:hypothetical protein [Hyphomicrobiales bacterium]
MSSAVRQRQSGRYRRWIAVTAALIALLGESLPLAAQSLFSPPETVPPGVQVAPPGPSIASPDFSTRAVPPPSANPATRTQPMAPRPGTTGIIPPALGGISVSGRFGDGSPISGKLHWRVFPEKPDQTGSFRMIKEETGSSAIFTLPPGAYIVHVAMGLASAAKRVQVRADMAREVFDLSAGGVRFEGRVGDTPIPAGQISFEVYPGSQFDGGDNRRPIATDIASGALLLLPEGTYHVVSTYGDGNAVMRYDFRVQTAKLTDARINHRAAMMTLKLVSERGGEAIANTAWSVLTPGGDVIKESIGAFPSVVLAEGEYVVIARNDGKVFNREFKVEPGVDREIELIAR